MFGACLTDENSILNIRMQQFKDFHSTLAYRILGLLFMNPMFATESSRQIRAFEYGMASATIASDCE
jgi:hypothetical protein